MMRVRCLGLYTGCGSVACGDVWCACDVLRACIGCYVQCNAWREMSTMCGAERRRIAKGSGNDVMEVNKLIKQFEDTRKMMKLMSNKKNMMGLMKNMSKLGGGIQR